MLEIIKINKSYGGVHAVRDFSLTSDKGEIKGLIGPNGAGKSTLINLISGAIGADSGSVIVNGVNLVGKGPEFAARAGVGRTFQNLRLFPHLTVRQNIEVALTTARKVRPDTAKKFQIEKELEYLGLSETSDSEAGNLSYGNQRRVEILRALALCPYIMLLDEPAAGMNDLESEDLAKEIRRIRDVHQCSIIVIDHDLKFIMNLCENIAVMDMGALIATGTAEEVSNDPRVVEVYMGVDEM